MKKHYLNLSLKDVKSEVWMLIKRYNGNYSVSTVGRVKIKGRSINNRKYPEKIKRPSIDQHGYIHTTLSFNGKYKVEKHHRLVAEAFIPNPENKPFINHKNSIRWDNRVENLEWCTAKENSQHSIKSGRQVILYGADTSMSKLTNKQAVEIFNSSKSAKILSEKYKVSWSCIYGIKSGLYYSEITGKKYNKKELKTSSLILELKGVKMNQKQLADKLGGTPTAIYERFKKGWDIEKIFTTPIKKYNYNTK